MKLKLLKQCAHPRAKAPGRPHLKEFAVNVFYNVPIVFGDIPEHPRRSGCCLSCWNVVVVENGVARRSGK
jgi:hypothetical protein